jgi:SAM-dependent methyltransferase
MTPTERWLTALEARHFSNLTFQEVSRSLRALSATYVEKRGRIREGAALSGAGKRAAFALFYGPLHYLLVREIVRAIAGPEGAGSQPSGGAALAGPPTLIDLGCGTGAAGAAWAEAGGVTQVVGIDINPWTLTEAAHTYRDFGLRARTVRGDVASAVLPKSPALILAAFTVNELSDESRAIMLARLLDRAQRGGDRVLIVEPLARTATPWWPKWEQAFAAAGGRADEWRFRAELPPIVAKLDRAAGLRHSELTGRTLYAGQA